MTPISYEQEQIWLHTMLAAGLPLYNETVTICYRGEPDLTLFESSLSTLCLRHGSLRTTFPQNDGVPAQSVGPATRIKVEAVDLSSLPEDEKERQRRAVASEFATRPFDLARGPLFRVLAARLGSNETRFYLTIHHLIFDGDSLRRILLPELIEVFTALSANRTPALPPQPLQYTGYTLSQQARSATPREDALTFWRAKLADLSPLTLPTDRARTPQTSVRGATHRFAFDEEFSGQLREFARQERTTVFNVFFASFAALLARYSDAVDITLGTTYSDRSDTDSQDVLGCFLNTLLLRTDLSGDPSFSEVLARVREVTLEAVEHAGVPFQRVVRECLKRTNTGEPPVQFVLSFQPPPPELPEGWDLDVFEISNGTAKFDIHFEIEEKDGAFRGRLHYNTDLFDSGTIDGLERHWRTLLRAAIDQPQTSFWKLPLLAAGEEEWLRVTLNRTEQEFPQACIHDLFAKKAKEAPDRIAASCRGRNLTYRQLDQASARLAHHLTEIGFGSGAIIGLMVERSNEMLVALLGILRAGATYVPMDPKYPPARLEHMLRASGAGLLLTQASLTPRLPDAEFPRLDVVEHLARPAGRDESGAVLPQVPLSSVAYIIFTSGSTGVPKGVEVPHRALTNFLWWALETPGMQSGDVLLAIASICFDIAGLELFLPLLAGARVEIASSEEAANPELLRAKIDSCGTTVLQATPVTWRMLIESGWFPNRPIKVLSGGEAMTENLARQLVERSPSVWNLYGPTETTIYSTGTRVPEDFQFVTLGAPAANTTLYILDSHRNLVPAGVSGELYIGGAGLADGYRGQPDLTRERFLHAHFGGGQTCRLYRTGDRVKRLRDGSLVFLGRMDRQVKLNGFRIELGEIEQVLNSLPGVQDSVVMKSQLPAGEEFLAGFIIPKVDCAVQVEELRSGLKKFLPQYMQPARLLVLTEVPLTPNGKLDRSRLPELVTHEEARDTELPLPGAEEQIAAIWRELLQLKTIGRRENFFDIGGHSLLALRFIARASRVFGRTLSLASFGQAPTIAEFASVVAGQPVPEVRLARHGSAHKQLLWMGADPWLTRHLENDLTMYTFALDSTLFAGPSALDTIEAMASRLLVHIKKVQPRGPYVIGGYCIHGLLAYEVAQQLQQAGDQVALLVLADFYVPGRDPERTPMGRFTNRMRLEIFRFLMMFRWPIERWVPYVQRRWQQMFDRKHYAGPPRNLHEALVAAEAKYRGIPYQGRVLFLESDEGRLFQPTASASWRDLIRDMEVFPYAGDHEAVSKEPQLSLAVAYIQKAVDSALPQGSPPAL